MEEVCALSCDIAPSPTPVVGMERYGLLTCDIAPSPTPVVGMGSVVRHFSRHTT